jgi:hypothetical protein
MRSFARAVSCSHARSLSRTYARMHTQVRSARLHVQRKARASVVGAKEARAWGSRGREDWNQGTRAEGGARNVGSLGAGDAGGGDGSGRDSAGASGVPAKHYWQADEIDPDQDTFSDSSGDEAAEGEVRTRDNDIGDFVVGNSPNIISHLSSLRPQV